MPFVVVLVVLVIIACDLGLLQGKARGDFYYLACASETGCASGLRPTQEAGVPPASSSGGAAVVRF